MPHSINGLLPHRRSTNESIDRHPKLEADESCIVTSDGEVLMKSDDPSDKYYLTYMIFYVLGMNTLLPWNFFITADDYWMYKFRDTTPGNDTSVTYSYSRMGILEKRNELQASFTSYVSVAALAPRTIFLIINTFISKKISLRKRMIGSQLVILVLFIVTTVLVKINTDNWQNGFLIITLTMVAAINTANAIYTGSVTGLGGRFPAKHISGMMAGKALGGIFTSLAEILSLWLGASPLVSGIIYFLIGDGILLFSLLAYIFLENAEFFKHYMLEQVAAPFSESDDSDEVPPPSYEYEISYCRIFKKSWLHALSAFMAFFVSLAVFPAVMVLVNSQGKGNAWNDKYFVPVATYLMFNSGNYLGRLVVGKFKWLESRPWLVMVFSFLRIILIPLIMVCNAYPRSHLPVYIHGDVYFILISAVLGMTNGYLCSVVIVTVPTVVDPEEREVVSSMMAAFQGVGQAAGSVVSLFMIRLL